MPDRKMSGSFSCSAA